MKSLKRKRILEIFLLYEKLERYIFMGLMVKFIFVLKSFQGLEKNYEKAFEYFYKASELGNWNTYASVGYMYLKGLGVERDID